MSIEAAVECHARGWAVTPLRGKQPILPAWSSRPPPSVPDIYAWADECDGFGVRCGAVSGGLVVIDVEAALADDHDRYRAVLLKARESGVGDILAAAHTGARAVTPSGGWHLFFAVTGEAPRSTKLCYRRDGDAHTLLAETRGEGGQVVAPGAEGRGWAGAGGSVVVTDSDFGLILDAFRSIDEARESISLAPRRAPSAFTVPRSLSVADILTTAILAGDLRWSDVLDPGWSYVGQDHHGRTMWLRPDYGNKPTSLSSAHGFESAEQSAPVLVVHSAAVAHLPQGPGNRLTPGRVLALCWWGGDEARMYADLEAANWPEGLALPDRVRASIAEFALARERARASASLLDDEPEAIIADESHEQHEYAMSLLGEHVKAEWLRQEARDIVTRRRGGKGVEVPPSEPDGRAYLAVEDDDEVWSLGDLLPEMGNATLTAAFKAGKSSTMGELVRSLCDGVPFLGRFAPAALTGKVALWNYEISPPQQRRWLRDLDIANPERFVVLDLRGRRFPLVAPVVEDLAIQWLQEREVEWWIVDPFARAFVGCGDENSNSDVSVFLDTLDRIKQKAGVRQLVMPVHTGRPGIGGGEARARGAARLDDWPDVRWLLSKDEKTGERFFSAHGRDVDVAEGQVVMDARRRLRMGAHDRDLVANRALIDEIAELVRRRDGCHLNEVVKEATGTPSEIRTALGIAERYRILHKTPEGLWRATMWKGWDD